MNSAELSGAHCAKHPEAPATAICARCGAFVCEQCRSKLAWTHCAPCAALLAPSKLAKWSQRLGLGGFFGLFASFCTGPLFIVVGPLALLSSVAAIVVSSLELVAIRRGDAPESGLQPAKTGRLWGAITVAIVVSGIAALFALRWYFENNPAITALE